MLSKATLYYIMLLSGYSLLLSPMGHHGPLGHWSMVQCPWSDG